MASSMPLCGVCDYRKISKPALVWCSECDKKYCTDCSEHHSSAKPSRHHTTTPIDVFQKLPTHLLETEQFCREHDDRFTLFCKNHESPCCRTCSFEKHKQCPNIAKIEDVVQNVKLSNVFQETEQSLNDLAASINKIQNDRKNNLESVENSKMYVEKKIQEFRVKLKHLDKLQDDIIKKLYKAKETEKKAIQNIVDDLQQKGKDVKENQVSLTNIKQYASDLQAYLAMKKIQSDVGKTEDAIESLINSNKLQQKAISIKINPAIEEILSQIKTFGDIIVEQRGCNVEIKKKKNQQAQLLVQNPIRSIDDIKLQLQQILDVNSSQISGCCTLPDGRLVFTNYKKYNIILMNADGTHNIAITTPSYAFDVTYVKYNNSVAVTSGGAGEKYITFIDIKTNKVTETISLQTDSYGIAEKNNILYFCTYDSINSLNLTDKTIKKIIDTKPGTCTYIAIHENKLYHTNYETKTITCNDLSGEVKWEYRDESIDPMGISVDNGGNVFVAGDRNSYVVVISPDGQKCRELLSTKDKLSGPWAIHYYRSTGNLIVANKIDQTTFFYKVT